MRKMQPSNSTGLLYRHKKMLAEIISPEHLFIILRFDMWARAPENVCEHVGRYGYAEDSTLYVTSMTNWPASTRAT